MKFTEWEGNKGRFIAASIDKTTGCHQLLFTGGSASYTVCLAACQQLGPVEGHRHRMMFKAHDNLGEEPKEEVSVHQTPVLTVVKDN